MLIDEITSGSRTKHMPELIANCPRCDAQKVTFIVEAAHVTGQEYGWMNWYEVCAQCRHCHRYTVFSVYDSVDTNYQHFHQIGILNYAGVLNDFVRIRGYVSLKDEAAVVSGGAETVEIGRFENQ